MIGRGKERMLTHGSSMKEKMHVGLSRSSSAPLAKHDWGGKLLAEAGSSSSCSLSADGEDEDEDEGEDEVDFDGFPDGVSSSRIMHDLIKKTPRSPGKQHQSCYETFRQRVLLFAGIKLSKDGKCVFNYNPGKYQAFVNFIVAAPFLPTSGLFFNKATIAELWALMALMMLWSTHLSDTSDSFVKGDRDKALDAFHEQIAPLTTFVLGLYVSLLLAHTYYANRAMFGTVFGASMGLAQMIVAWVQAPPCVLDQSHHCPRNSAASTESAAQARRLLIRWINAAFRLMWLESVPGMTNQAVAADILDNKLLTQAEWDHIASLPSRCTHIYQWMNNVLHDLCSKGYISPFLMVRMNTQIDDMRGANVWGLPSLPFPYTMIVTQIVKLNLVVLACSLGGELNFLKSSEDVTLPTIVQFVRIVMELAFYHYFMQGLLDLHGVLYNPNSGGLLGHMPAVNFMDFVRTVTENLDALNQTLPYSLHIVDCSKDSDAVARPSGTSAHSEHPRVRFQS